MTNEMNYFDSLMRNNENNGAIEYIDVKKVYDNPLNKGREIALIDELVDNLLQNGLQQPIIVKKEADDHFTIISGHRRTLALRKIIAEGKGYLFNGKEIYGNIPCVITKIEDPLDEELAVLVGNAHSDDSKEEKKRRCIALEDLYFKRKDKGFMDGEKRKWISSMSGFSERSVSNYLKESKSEKKNDKNEFDRFYETLKRLSSYKYKVDLEGVDPKIMTEIKRMFKDVKGIIYPRD